MMSASARLSLPFLSPGQAQKEFFHNEALQTLDLLVAPAVEEGPRDAPPASPNIGACYLVGASPSGDWVGKSMCIAGYTSGGWRLIQPTEGMTAYVKSTGQTATYREGAWEIAGGQVAAIPGPSGGSNVDVEARAAIDQVLAALRHHGLIES
jgi:hypothetical protein